MMEHVGEPEQAFKELLGDKKGIHRYGEALCLWMKRLRHAK
jgi:imidazoleglycerol phosphate dehydratase HisB